nr:DUF6559 family protein [Colwellia sp. E2M01]
MPKALIKAFDKQSSYSIDEVTDVFNNKFKYPHNIEYAYAMFCSQSSYEEQTQNLASSLSYSSLRLEVSKKCFSNWPRFNFDSLLMYSQGSGIGDGGGGDGGCGGD